ncbi:hypothetical protein NKH18_24065 [Streptomyces sp. M10(2022)]
MSARTELISLGLFPEVKPTEPARPQALWLDHNGQRPAISATGQFSAVDNLITGEENTHRNMMLPFP